MRAFELVDGERRGARPCAVVSYDPASQTFSARVLDWAGPADVPAIFIPFVERGERDIPPRWVRAWVDERIAPPSRQNIGQVLRAHGLEEYDPCALLISGEGRSAQDGFYLREIDAAETERAGGSAESARIGRAIAQERTRQGITQEELAQRCGVRQETVGRIERGQGNPTLKTLTSIATALGKRLEVELG